VVIYNKMQCKAAEEAIKVQRPEGGAGSDEPSEDILVLVHLTF